MLWPKVESEISDVKLLLAIGAQTGKLMWLKLLDGDLSSNSVDGAINKTGSRLLVRDREAAARDERSSLLTTQRTREHPRARSERAEHGEWKTGDERLLVVRQWVTGVSSDAKGMCTAMYSSWAVVDGFVVAVEIVFCITEKLLKMVRNIFRKSGATNQQCEK